MSGWWVITLAEGDPFREYAESVDVLPSGVLRIVTRPGQNLVTRYINSQAWLEAASQR